MCVCLKHANEDGSVIVQLRHLIIPSDVDGVFSAYISFLSLTGQSSQDKLN